MSVRHGLRDVGIGAGLQVLAAMLAEDRTALCGPARQKQSQREA